MSSNIIPRANEVVIAFVQPVGTELDNLRKHISESCSKFNTTVEKINLTDLIDDLSDKEKYLAGHDVCASFTSKGYLDLSKKMHIGSSLRKSFGKDIFALYGLSRICTFRDSNKKELDTKTAIYVLDSLKHPAEVKLLRETYKESFFLIGVDSPKSVRKEYLKKVKSMTDNEANELINRDEDEGADFDYGQKMSKVFEQSDFFTKSIPEVDEIDRFVKLVFGDTKISPTEQEYCMHLAASTAASSGDLSRQVGAVIVSEHNEIIAVGRNEVPKFGGGQYWYGDIPDHTDRNYGYEANHKKREECKENLGLAGQKNEYLDNITEYVRSVHAEMEAILSCARKGQSVKNSILFCTTFPCHNCAKHMVNAGIKSVVYIEAYPKSQALDLHSDSLVLDELNMRPKEKMSLVRFYGVGPRRYLDLFSQTLSAGRTISRKHDNEGNKTPWLASVFDCKNATPRFPVLIILAASIEKNALKKITDFKILGAGRQDKFIALLKAA